MIRSALLFALLIGQAAVAQTVVKEMMYEGALAPTRTAPSFDNGRLIVYERGLRISIRPPGGAPAITLSTGTAATGVSTINAAVDTDGEIAASVIGSGTVGLAIFQPDGKQERFIETSPYEPVAIRFGPDHSVWTLSQVLQETSKSPTDYAVLRNYARDGRLIGAYLPRDMFKADAVLLPLNQGLVLLHVAAGRVGMMIDFTQAGRSTQWLETDLNGKLTGRWDLPYGYWVQGLTSGGSVYASGNPGSPLVNFDRATQKWNPISIPAEGRLLAVDGEHLVFLDRESGLARWFTAPK